MGILKNACDCKKMLEGALSKKLKFKRSQYSPYKMKGSLAFNGWIGVVKIKR